MLRILMIGFLIAHGLVHVTLRVTPKPEQKENRPNPVHSWLLGDQKALTVTLAIAAAAVLVTAGIALWAHAAWWTTAAVAGLAMSFALIVLVFHRWFVFIELVNAGLIASLIWLEWPSTLAMETLRS